MKTANKRAWLILADGTVYEGKSFGAAGTVFGELVCTTGMTGFQESLTDQSYYGQIVAQTFPLMGNYGINDYKPEKSKVWASGYIVREHCENPSNFRSEMGLNDFLTEQNAVAIYGIDTRALTRRVRTYGTMNCAITDDFPTDFHAFLKTIAAYKPEPIPVKGKGEPPEIFGGENAEKTVVVFDYGVCDDIVKSLVKRNCKAVCISPATSLDDALKLSPDGFVIADGAGAPDDFSEFYDNIRSLLAQKLPVFGIGLGHQLMAAVNGAKIDKMHYGHRGANQPVLCVKEDKVYISSQNHGYVVDSDTLPSEVGVVSYKNINDSTCEGIEYKNANAISLQYNPEPSSGPIDLQKIYDDFIAMMK